MHIAHRYIVQEPGIKMADPDPQKGRGWKGRVGVKSGQGRNERSDIVTRVESTPKKKVRLQGEPTQLHKTGRWSSEQVKVKDKGMKSEDPLTVTQYPERHIITEQRENRE